MSQPLRHHHCEAPEVNRPERRCDKNMENEWIVYLFKNEDYPQKIIQQCVPAKSSSSSVYSNAEGSNT